MTEMVMLPVLGSTHTSEGTNGDCITAEMVGISEIFGKIFIEDPRHHYQNQNLLNQPARCNSRAKNQRGG